jgi:hypothetical protein
LLYSLSWRDLRVNRNDPKRRLAPPQEITPSSNFYQTRDTTDVCADKLNSQNALT